MPIDEDARARFAYLDGLPSVLEALANPEHVAQLDAFNAWESGYQSPPVDVTDERCEGPHGTIPMRIYRSSRGQDGAPRKQCALVWLHGGGWLSGDLDMPESDVVAREIADRADATVITVDYRLAVDGVSYPVPHDDVVASFRWVANDAERLCIKSHEIALGGASAGANLACGAAMRLRDELDAVLPYRLLLAYPVVHSTIPPLSAAQALAMQEVPDVLRFPPDVMAFLTGNYLGQAISTTDAVPAYAMPAVGDLHGLPATTIITSEYDDLRPSGEALGELMREAGGKAQVLTESGALHGHLNWDPRRALVDHSLSILAQALTNAFPSE